MKFISNVIDGTTVTSPYHACHADSAALLLLKLLLMLQSPNHLMQRFSMILEKENGQKFSKEEMLINYCNFPLWEW